MRLRKCFINYLLIAAVAASSLVGCGGAESTASVAETTDPAWEEARTTPYGKYPETVNYTLGKIAGNYQPLAGSAYEGDTDSNNAWTRYMKEKLNVQNENLFEANDGDDYEQKVSMAIVGGDIPDIMTVSDYETLKQLYENDMIVDLSQAYENCASDRIKEIYDSYEGRCLDTAKFDGKLMALPTTEISHGPGVLWLRKDWMDKLLLEEPKTIEDIEHILQEFLDKDPGANGAGKTVGLIISTDIAGTSGGAYMVNNIFARYGAYPKQWVDDGSGKAVYGSVLPEMKEALTLLSDWYKKGLIDKQLAVRTTDDCKALLTSGKSGAVMDNWWGSWTVAETKQLDPEAVWVPYVTPVGEDGAVSMFTGNPNSGYLVVRKGFEYPELAVKLANLQFDYSRYEDTVEESTKEIREYNALTVSGEILAMNIDYYDAMVRGAEKMKNALETSNQEELNIREKVSYEGYKRYLDSIKAGEEVGVYDWAGYVSSVECTDLVGNTEIKEINPLFFGNTPSMSLKWPTLMKMEQEMYLKIITGEEPVSYFDSFVENWKKTGGDQITNEVNEAIAVK